MFYASNGKTARGSTGTAIINATFRRKLIGEKVAKNALKLYERERSVC